MGGSGSSAHPQPAAVLPPHCDQLRLLPLQPGRPVPPAGSSGTSPGRGTGCRCPLMIQQRRRRRRRKRSRQCPAVVRGVVDGGGVGWGWRAVLERKQWAVCCPSMTERRSTRWMGPPQGPALTQKMGRGGGVGRPGGTIRRRQMLAACPYCISAHPPTLAPPTHSHRAATPGGCCSRTAPPPPQRYRLGGPPCPPPSVSRGEGRCGAKQVRTQARDCEWMPAVLAVVCC